MIGDGKLPRSVTVTLTGPQVDALIAAAAYCQAGGPEDWGQDGGPDGYRRQRNLGRGFEALHRALDAANARARS